MPADERAASQVEADLLKAYRWQYIVSGALEPRFQKVLGEPGQRPRRWRASRRRSRR